MCGFYCTASIEFMNAGKPLSDNTNLSFELSLKIIDETRNYTFEKIKHNDLISKKHLKKSVGLWITFTTVLFLFLLSLVVWISAFASLVGFSISIVRINDLSNSAICSRKNRDSFKIKKCVGYWVN